MASEISPTVARASTAAMIARHQVAAVARGVGDASSAAASAVASRDARERADALDLLPLDRRIDPEDVESTLPGSSVANRLTPTTTVSPESIACCARYADS